MHTTPHPHLSRKTGAAAPLYGRKHAQGFSLIEIIIAIVVVGVLTLILSQNFAGALSAFSTAQDEEQEALNKRLASVALDYAATVSPTGKLPTPELANYQFNLADPTLKALLVEARITPREANDTPQYARVYQVATPPSPTINVPLYGATGPAVTLAYEEGVIVATHCRRTEACNTPIPGASGVFNTTTFDTYTLQGEDFGLARFSTLGLQKLKLARTAENIDTIRTRMQEIFRERQRQTDANSTTNFFPRPAVFPSAIKTPDCINAGWFNLDSDILGQIGLTANQYGFTAWGGKIQYCPDFDPTGSAIDTPPHFAALRILSNPSTGGDPDATNSLVIPF